MKTQLKYQIAACVLMVGFGLSSVSAQAQRNEVHKGNKKEYKYEKGKGNIRGDHADHYSFRDFKRNDRNKYAYKSGKHCDSKYYNRMPALRHCENERYAYRHAKYGNVYRQFYSKPKRLRHAHGDIYYHSGHYYSYHPHVGYVQVGIPSGYVFASLPGSYERIYSSGHVYFRVGDMMFERCAQGYRLAPNFNVTFSARF